MPKNQYIPLDNLLDENDLKKWFQILSIKG